MCFQYKITIKRRIVSNLIDNLNFQNTFKVENTYKEYKFSKIHDKSSHPSPDFSAISSRLFISSWVVLNTF